MKTFAPLVFFTIVLTALSVFGVSTYAQLPLDVSLVITPASPAPGETITARAVLVGGDPGHAVFQWFKNGTLAGDSSGKGRDSFSFSPSKEPRLTIDVIVTTPEGKRASATRAITRERPVIVWWAGTFIPSWYRGKAIPSPESTVTILAVPGAGFSEPASDLRYSWSINLEPYPKISGVGKNRFTLAVSRAMDASQQITVKISNKNQTIAQESTIVLPTRRPEGLIYRLSPAGEIDAAKSLATITGSAGEVHDFIAYPFFFRSDRIKTAIYQWQVNTRSITGTFDRPNMFTLRTRPGEKTSNNIKVNVKETGTNPQEVEAAFTANFQ